MKPRTLLIVAASLVALAGCATGPEPAETRLRLGMSRDDLRLHFGEPLRIEPADGGGEKWFYQFVGWKTSREESTSVEQYGAERTSTVSVSWHISDAAGEHPICLSAEGRVIEPLPPGKVVRR